MVALFGLLGFFGSLICLVLLVIKAIRKKPKKPTIIALAVCFVVFVVCLAIPTDSSKAAPATEPTPTPTAEATAEPTPEPTVEPIADPAQNVEYVKLLLEITLENSYDYYSVDGDETGITINVTGEGLAEAVVIAKAAGYDENYSEWVAMKESTIECSDGIMNLMKESGMEDAVLMFNVLNNQNHDNILLSLINSIVIYDVMADK